MEFLSTLHPVVIHFPIVLFILYFLFELTNFFTELKFSSVSHILLIGGIIAGVVAVLSGNQAAETNVHAVHITDSAILEIIDKHETFASLTLWYFLLILVVRTYLLLKKKLSKKMVLILSVASLLGTVFVYYTGIYGGQLVYKFGIGTDLIK